MRTNLTAALWCITALTASACEKTEVRSDTAAPVVTPQGQTTLVVTEVAGALATRREPQEYLDRARQGILDSDAAAAAEALAMATPMLREHAEGPVSTAKIELRAIADSLDGLAIELKVGTMPGGKSFDALLVRVNVAEAEHHRSLATFAWSKHDDKTTGEELIMSADHLDRAMRDAKRESRTAKTTVSKALDLGGRMATAKPFQDWEINTSLAALGKAIQDQARP